MDVGGNPSPSIDDRRSIASRGASWLVGPMLGFLAGRATAPSDRDADLVQVTSVALDRGQAFWSARVAGWRDARVVLVDRETDTPCGLTGAGPFYCARDGRVYLDLAFLRAVDGDLARAYVVAHELAHHVQAVSGDPSSGVARELGADCLAGLWAGDEMRRGRVLETDVDGALAEASRVGDDRSCPTCAPEEWSHGSGAERAAAFARGIGGGPC
jgi:predicted metalloprotease